jgi:dipeptidase D
MRGGHSGVDIHKHRANAIKVLARALHELNRSSRIRLVSIEGGTVANAIPREAEALVTFDPMRFADLQRVASEFEKVLQEEYSSTERSLALTLSESETKASHTSALIHEDTNRVINLLLSLPNGVAAMSADLEGVVETSNNLGVVGMREKSVNIVSFQRSSVMSGLEEITAAVEETATRTGAKGKTSGTFPPWEPDMKSPLLKQCEEVYRAAFGTDPHVSTVHGGLECSVIGVKYPDMDMISFGPTIVSLHSPDEKLHIPSVQKAWDFLIALLKSYGP